MSAEKLVIPEDLKAIYATVSDERRMRREDWYCNYSVVAKLIQRIAHVEAENKRLREALDLVFAQRGLCIFNEEPAFRAGSNAAFEECSAIAEEALRTK